MNVLLKFFLLCTFLQYRGVTLIPNDFTAFKVILGHESCYLMVL